MTTYTHEDGTERFLPDDSPAMRAAILERDGLGEVSRVFARNMTTGAIGAYTRTGNVILADAVGAIGAIDGVTNVAGDRLFLNTGAAAAADVGVYVFDSVGAAAARFQLTRAPEMDASADVAPSMTVTVEAGTANADRTYILTTNDPIVLNTTALTFALMPSYTDLGAAGGAARIGSTGPSTVQADITARPTAAVLAAVGGAATVGSVGPSTVQADITALQALAHHTYASRVIGFADIAALGAFVTGFIDFAAALPANAIVIGSYVNVTAIVDNVTDTATLTCDVGIAGTINLLLDGVSLNGVAVLGAPLGTIPTGFKGPITVRVTIDSDVNLNTITKGSFTVHVVYIVGP